MTRTDRFLDAIGSRQRRRLLVELLAHNPADDRRLYVEEVAADDPDPEALLLELHHAHLPLLESYGFVEWDEDEHAIVKGPAFDEIRPALELLDDNRDELPDGWL